MKRSLARNFPNRRLSHFESSVEEHSFFHRQQGCFDAAIDDGRRPQLHLFLGSDVAGDLALADNGASAHLRGNDGFLSDKQDPFGMDLAFEVSIDTNRAVI